MVVVPEGFNWIIWQLDFAFIKQVVDDDVGVQDFQINYCKSSWIFWVFDGSTNYRRFLVLLIWTPLNFMKNIKFKLPLNSSR